MLMKIPPMGQSLKISSLLKKLEVLKKFRTGLRLFEDEGVHYTSDC